MPYLSDGRCAGEFGLARYCCAFGARSWGCRKVFADLCVAWTEPMWEGSSAVSETFPLLNIEGSPRPFHLDGGIVSRHLAEQEQIPKAPYPVASVEPRQIS